MSGNTGNPFYEHRTQLAVNPGADLADVLIGLGQTLEAFAIAVDRFASTTDSPGSGPQHRLKNMSKEERDAYDRGYRAGYSRAARKYGAFERVT